MPCQEDDQVKLLLSHGINNITLAKPIENGKERLEGLFGSCKVTLVTYQLSGAFGA